MKVNNAMIDPQLRVIGRLSRFFLRYRSEAGMKIMGRLSRVALSGRKSRILRSEDRLIPKEDGAQLHVRIYSSRQERAGKQVPGVPWIHGGGYALGSATMAIPYAEMLMEAGNCIVIAPEYTLSIDKPYPAALLDCYTALLWMKTHAADFGIREDQLFIGGDSAGGGLTAALSLYARDKGAVNIAWQMPLYPMIDDRMTSESMRDNDAPMWNEHANRIGWKLYLGDLFGTDEVPAYAAPARETDYGGLPPTFTIVGSLDPFRDETVQYIESLRGAGIEAELYEYEGCFHAFDQANSRSNKSRDAIEKLQTAFQRAAANYYAPQADG